MTATPSCQWVKAGLHPGHVGSLSQGHRERQATDDSHCDGQFGPFLITCRAATISRCHQKRRQHMFIFGRAVALRSRVVVMVNC